MERTRITNRIEADMARLTVLHEQIAAIEKTRLERGAVSASPTATNRAKSSDGWWLGGVQVPQGAHWLQLIY